MLGHMDGLERTFERELVGFGLVIFVCGSAALLST